MFHGKICSIAETVNIPSFALDLTVYMVLNGLAHQVQVPDAV
jgi:hypothetical protein